MNTFYELAKELNRLRFPNVAHYDGVYIFNGEMKDLLVFETSKSLFGRNDVVFVYCHYGKWYRKLDSRFVRTFSGHTKSYLIKKMKEAVKEFSERL